MFRSVAIGSPGILDSETELLHCLPAPAAPLDTPERSLWRAVLEDAVAASSVPDEAGCAARRWFRGGGRGVGSFAFVAAHLGLDCGALLLALEGRWPSGVRSARARRSPSGASRTFVRLRERDHSAA